MLIFFFIQLLFLFWFLYQASGLTCKLSGLLSAYLLWLTIHRWVKRSLGVRVGVETDRKAFIQRY